MAALLKSFLISSLTQLAITTLLPFFYSSCCSRNRIVPHYPNFFFPSSTTAAVQQKSIQQVTLFPFFCNGISITVSSDFLTNPILDYNSSFLLLQQLLFKKLIQQTWPVRTPRPVASKLAADTPLLTGQVRYFLFLCVDCSSRVQSSAHYPKARGDDVEKMKPTDGRQMNR
ncbi:V-type proton ATPase catalytic subunit A [Linum perenne]